MSTKRRKLVQPKKVRTLNYAIRAGRLDWVQEMILECPSELNINTLTLAITLGHAEIVQALLDAHCPMNEENMYHAAHSGRMELVKMLHQAGCPHSRGQVEEWLTFDSRLEDLEWVFDHFDDFYFEWTDVFIRHCNMKALQWIDQVLPRLVDTNKIIRMNTPDIGFALATAIRKNRMDVVQWCHDHNIWPSDCVDLQSVAAIEGHWTLLQWLQQHRPTVLQRMVHVIRATQDLLSSQLIPDVAKLVMGFL